jgi:site-specific DNA-cytosine methylase
VAVQDIALTTSKPEHVLWESSHGYDPARVMSNQDIVPTLSAKMGTGGNNVPNIGVRRLTPIECERLQGFPDVQKSCIITIWEHYTDQQKNSVIAEILSHKLPKHVLNAESHELTESALSVVQNSLLKHQKDNKHVVVDVHINFERNTLEIRSHGKSHLSVNIAETQNLCHLPIKTGDFVQALVLITTIVGSEMHNGKVVSRQNMTHSIVQQNGKNVVVLSGKEIMEHAEDAVLNMPIINQSIKSITSEVEVSFLSYAQTLTTLCCYVSHVITSFIPDVTLPTSSLSLNLTTSKGWTAEQADTHRYKQLGNAVSVPVAHWIGKKIMEAENGK